MITRIMVENEENEYRYEVTLLSIWGLQGKQNQARRTKQITRRPMRVLKGR